MMRIAVALLAALGLTLPATALGAKPSVSAVIHAEASNGYHLSLKASARHSVALELSRGRASATYEPRGDVRVTARRIRFRLGPLGRVDLRFHESDRFDSPGGHCKPQYSERVGRFRGQLRFSGEGAYSEFEAHSVNGKVVKFGRFSCQGQHFAAPSDPDPRFRVREGRDRPFLLACGPADGTILIANRVTADLSIFVALSSERTSYARIDRTTLALGKSGTFRTSGHLSAAELKPPGPLFKGSASYASGATEGDLTALLPGLGDVPMVPGEALLSKDYRDDPPGCNSGNRSGAMRVAEDAALAGTIRSSVGG